ncbi:MAG: gliding motility-associated C-terminal domain-containing protein [Bacteroidetes bacterium]|nr:gliding motility-associated C-terminal domain-containing protein [Bacteroidota bacterium]
MRNQLHLNLLLFIFLIGISNSSKAQIIEVNSIKCYGDSTGQLTVSPNFGTPPYSYLWNTGQTSQSINGLIANTYSVTITENGGGVQNYSYLLNNPPALGATFALTNNNSWPINTGSILMNPSGGTGWYNYSVYDSTSHFIVNQGNSLFGALASGAYYVKITDLYNCQFIDTVHINENAGLQVGFTIDYTACYNSTAPSSFEPTLSGVYPIIVNFDNTSIFTIIDTVLGPKPYVMSNIIDTLSTISGEFEPGFHMAIISSANGKGFRYSWNVDSVFAPVSIGWQQTNNLCFGNNNGTITSIAQGCYNDFTYKITGPNNFSVTTSSANNLFAGEYTVLATDSTGCALSQSISITQPDEPIRIIFDQFINPRCLYSGDGRIIIHRVEGATEPITYFWSNGNNSPKIEYLFPGSFSVTVTDVNNCIGKDTVSIIAEKNACIYNIVTPNRDGFNDYLDLTDFCSGMQMNAEIFNEAGEKIATLDETNPRWDASDPSNPPTGVSSTYTVFIELTKNNQLFKKWAESFSVIYSK